MWTNTGILFALNLAIALAGAQLQNGFCADGRTPNGTLVGSIQKFRAICSSTARGRQTTSIDVPTLDACADACATANPRCTAATYDGKSCAFHNETVPLTVLDLNPKFTALVGQPARSSSNCLSVVQATTIQTFNAKQFTLSCGTTLNSESLSNHFAASFQDCIGQCAQNPKCKGASFNADQSLGFQNCFLKAKESKAALVGSPLFDTAVLAKHQDVVNKDNSNPDTNGNATDTNTSPPSASTSLSRGQILTIAAVSFSSIVFLASLGVLAWWLQRRREHKRRLRSLPVGVMPISHKDRMDEKYGIRTSVAWSEVSREGGGWAKGEVEDVGRPTPVYEIRRKGDSYR